MSKAVPAMPALVAAATMTYSAPVLNAIALLASRAPACLEVSRKISGHVTSESNSRTRLGSGLCVVAPRYPSTENAGRTMTIVERLVCG